MDELLGIVIRLVMIVVVVKLAKGFFRMLNEYPGLFQSRPFPQRHFCHDHDERCC